MRAFIALPIPEPSIAALVGLQNTLAHGRAVPEENLHLTLAFLGDVSETVLDELHFELSRLRSPAPCVQFTGLAVYPATRQKLIVIEVNDDPHLASFAKQITTVARGTGLALPRRRFRPHVTLTRGRSVPSDLPVFRTPVPQFEATEFCLYRSTLSEGGARHEVLAAYSLV
ncbi:MAG: RNA 2',3'-cyclic phosphodiesterase [Pseudomonadota bacterium]